MKHAQRQTARLLGRRCVTQVQESALDRGQHNRECWSGAGRQQE